MGYELREAVRGLLRAPAHSATIVLILALAIGATTTIYSVVHGVLLRPLPFPDQDRLFMLWQRAPGVGVAEDWFSPAQYFDLREQVGSFEALALVYGSNVTLTDRDTEPERLGALNVSSSFFEVLRMQPALGRLFVAGDDTPGSAHKVLLGDRLFRRRFGGDPSIVGSSVEIDGEPVEVVGVLPAMELDADLLPTLATIPTFDLVTSLPIEDPQRTIHGSENYNVLARMAAGAPREQVETELQGVAEELVRDPGSLGSGLRPGSEYRIGLVPLRDQVVGRVELPLVVLLASTGLLLLIACANVANLLLSRAATLRRELAIRAALGAHPWRMILQSMLASALLAGAGAVAGLGLAVVGVRSLRLAAFEDLPRLGEVGVDLGVLLFAAGLSLASCLLFGLGPALQRSTVLAQDTLRRTAAGARAHSAWRGGSRSLVVVQVALSLVLTTGGVLLARTLWRLEATDPGFRTEGILTFRLSLVGERYRSQGERTRFYDRLFERLPALAGVTHAGAISMLPLTRGYAWTDFWAQGYDSTDDRDRIVADVHLVRPGYFEAMGIDLLAGRTFVAADDGEPPVVIVDRSFAQRLWPIQEAVGKWVGRNPEERATVVGVVDSIRHYGVDAESHLTVFYPHRQFGSRTLYGVVSSSVDPSTLAGGIADTVRGMDASLPVYDVRSMKGRFEDSLDRQRVVMSLVGLLAAIALTLAAVGLYGLLSFLVATHTREIGIRQAVGAQRRDIFRHVLRGAALVTCCGAVLGITASLIAARLIESMLYGVRTTDPLSFFAAAALIMAVSLSAGLLPARRAAAVDPVVTLRSE